MSGKRGFVVALLGAESTGKTTLSIQLRDRLVAKGIDAAIVTEHLREWCERMERTPHQQEQAEIAAEQTRRIEHAADAHDVVIADTTALMVAVYSDYVFADRTLYDAALADHARCGLTLVTAPDLPWVADDLQREGPHVQGPIDALVRSALVRGQQDFSVVMGQGEQRIDNVFAAVTRALQAPQPGPRWEWRCDHCDDNACERRVLRLAR